MFKFGAAAVVMSGFVAAGSVGAATIDVDLTNHAPMLGVTNFTTAGIGQDGYELFATDVYGSGAYTGYLSPSGYHAFGADGSVAAASYATVTPASGATFAEGNNYASIQYGSPAVSYYTGVARGSGSFPNVYTVLDITLQAGTPSSFILGVLDANARAYIAPGAVTVLCGSSSATQSVPSIGGNTNNFYFFTVTDAHAGDVIHIQSQVPYAHTVTPIGGVTFDPIPEPATLTLLGGGCVLMLWRRR